MTPGPWRKSSRSGSNGGQCVEARSDAVSVEVRDSKLSDGSPILSTSAGDWQDFLRTFTR